MTPQIYIHGHHPDNVPYFPPPPPSGGGGGGNPGRPNEPTGMTLITSRGFNAINEGGWTDGWGGNGTIVSDAAAPISPPNVLDLHLPAGFGEGGGPGSGDFTISPTYRTIYVQHSLMFSANWQGPASGVDKTFYLHNAADAPSVYFNMEGGGFVSKHPQMAGQDIVNAGSPSPGGDLANPDWGTNVVPGFTIARGTWHTIELVIVGNTSGTANGSMNWWADGTKIGSVTGVQFIAGAQTWGRIHYTLLYGGPTGNLPTSAQDVYYDHLYLSGK